MCETYIYIYIYSHIILIVGYIAQPQNPIKLFQRQPVTISTNRGSQDELEHLSENSPRKWSCKLLGGSSHES